MLGLNKQISPNASTAPDGTNTADLLYPAITGVVKAAIQSFTSGNGTPYAQSIYVKASGKNFAALYALNGNAGPAMWVNLTTGEITNGSIPNAFGQFATSVGNGWWRIGFTDIGNGGISYMHIYPTDVAGSQNVTANGTDGILIWGAQLEYGLVARDYIKTTTTAVEGGITDNVPRLDYTDSSCPALLLEPQRTNRNPYSEYFGTFWNTLGSPTITSNYGVSPEGLSNATRFQTTNAGRGGMYASIAVNNGETYTLSFYAKSLSGTQKIRIGADNGCANPQGAETFEVTTEWQKFTKTITSTQGGWNIFFDNVESGSGCTGTYLNCDMLVYGYQAEAGSYATSYIPTYGSSVSRVAESLIKTNVSSILNDDAGTLFLEIQGEVDSLSRALTLSDGTSQNRVQIFYQGSTKITTNIIRANVSQVDLNVFTKVVDQTATLKVIIRYEPNNAKMFVNGEQIAVDTSVNIPLGLNKISFDNGVGSSKFTGKLKNLIYIPTALTDQEAIDLTTI